MDEPIPETEISTRLGLPIEQVRQFRSIYLREGDGWVRGKKGRIDLTAHGVNALVAHLEATAEKKGGAPCDDVGAGGPIVAEVGRTPKKEVRRFYVTGFCLNKRIVMAAEDRQRKGMCVSVRVKNSTRYAIGMEIAAERREGAAWLIVGAPPRRRTQKSAVPAGLTLTASTPL